MKKQLINIIEGIKTYSGYYFSVVAVLGALWGAFAVYDNWKDNNVKMQSNVSTIIQTQKSQTKTDSILLVKQVVMETKLNEIISNTDQNADNLKSLSTSYIKYISKDKTLTKEDFLKYMDGLSFDVKKNSLTYPTVSNPKVPATIK
jgi:predicted metal-dependent HD superfamily phosphohydrolase